MQAIKISAHTRTDKGKNAARRLRAAGQIPAVAYGKGQPARALALAPEALVAALHSERGRNAVLELEVDGKSVQAMIGDYQYHPVSRSLLHADFVEVDDATLVDVLVPLVLTGKAKGIVLGGKLQQVFREVPVRCRPSDIPVRIEHDVTDLDVEQAVPASALKLPEGVTAQLPPRQTVASVTLDRRGKKGDEEGAEGAAAETK
jgi:large subunit ribosomal protein L25